MLLHQLMFSYLTTNPPEPLYDPHLEELPKIHPGKRSAALRASAVWECRGFGAVA